MPTITTTVTSAQATGAVTTVTTTEATPEPAAGSVASGNQYPKVSNGATYCLNQFQFKNKEDMMAFANSYLDGCQGNMVAGGCTQHAFEGTTPNSLISLFTFDNEKWQTQQDFWANNQILNDALGKVDYFQASYWGADIPSGLDAALKAWFSLPACRVGINCTEQMTTFNMKVLDNDPHKVVMLGFHDYPNDHWDGAMGDFTDFVKQFTYAHSFGNLGNGQCLVLQVFENGDDLGKNGDAFTPWLMSGANPACLAWLSESKITNYAVGGLNAAALAAVKPYGEGPNFTQVFPTLIGGVGGAGKGMSNIMFYFASKAVADGARAEWKELFVSAKAKGAKIDGTLTTMQGNDSTLNVFIHYATPADWAVVHQVAYESPGFLANCAKKMMHAQVDSYGSMTYELASTFGGWESLGSCYFSDALKQQIMSSFYAEQPGDSPVESVQYFETKGDHTVFTDFFTDKKIQDMIVQHRVSFAVQDYGGNNLKLYFKFPNSASFAQFWGDAAGDKLTAFVEQGVDINVWYWGELDAAGQAVIAHYGGLPQFAVNGVREHSNAVCAADRC